MRWKRRARCVLRNARISESEEDAVKEMTNKMIQASSLN